MSNIDLRQCREECLGCVKSYKKKHGKDQSFTISCKGIPISYVPEKVLATLSYEDANSAIGMLDPVQWAANILDWHCWDKDGEIWKRKSREDTLPQGCINYYDDQEASAERVRLGKSPFHRPYQAEMLRCSSKRKVFRLGRQSGKTECLVVSMLHSIFTNGNFKVILVTPFSSQINMIFKRIREFLEDNALLMNSKKRMVAAPTYELELHNGSYIRGFTAGTSSKGNATQVRGQPAHMLVFDEADYLSDGDMAAALAVVINSPNATVWMSSTPCGKREKFYDACHNSMYKEFFYPSMVNPNWGPEQEAFFRSEYSEIEYAHEVLAEFGKLEQGVFQVAYVEAALRDYNYSDCKRTPGWQYCIGVDWNDTKIGTTIVVTGWNPYEQRFEVVDRKNVSKEGWTQLAACNEIVRLNRLWLPEAIYVDAGYGGTQQEVLKAFAGGVLTRKGGGPKQTDARILKVLHEYQFGGSIEIRDPFTKQKVKKPAKPFLVENTVRKFEQSAIVFSKEDDQLKAELLGYIVDHVTTAGMPVYKQSNEKVGDHNLDALMLSIVGFDLTLSAYGKPQHETHISFSGYFGEGSQYDGMKIVREDPGKLRRDKVEQQRPDPRRNEEFAEQETLFPSEDDKKPAANLLKRDTKPAIWSYPGFTRDAKPPKGRVTRKKSGPPKRSKF
jgi:replicative DNA helicase